MIDRREFLAGGLGIAATIGSTGAANALGAAETIETAEGAGTRREWFRKGTRTFLLDFQFPDPVDQGVPGMPHFFQRFDPASLVEQVAASGAKVFIVHAKDNQGNCYYNTKIGHKHSDLGDRDLVAEVSRLCRQRGLGILYYVQLPRDRRSFEEHPDRRAINKYGRPVRKVADNPLLPSPQISQICCMNGPHRMYIKDILAELSRGYDFDGFWLDGFGWWGGRVNPCFCEFCKTAYRRDTGEQIPIQDLFTTSDGKRYIDWRRRLNTTILKDIIGTVRGINPRFTVTHNASAVLPWFNWEFCDTDDYVSHEYHFSEGYENLSLLCQRQRALKPGVPFEIEIWRFACRPNGRRPAMRAYEVRGTENLLTEMASVAAHGGFPQYYDQSNPDGTIDARSLRMVTPAFREVAARQPWCGVGEPVGYAAVLWSKASEVLAPPNDQTLYRNATVGTFTSLMEAHVPTTLLTERDIVARRWRGAQVIVVDCAECLSPECCQALAAYTQSGGGLVVTARSSMRDGEGRQLKNFGLAALLGADYEGTTAKWYSFVAPDQEHPVTEGLDLRFPLSVYQTLQVRTTARSNTRMLGVIVDPMRGFSMGFPPLKRTEIPSVLVREHGKGRVVYVSAALGAIYNRVNHPDYRRILTNAVRWAAGGAPPVTLDAPGTVEMVAWRDEKSRRTVVHLVNRTGVGLPQGEGAYQEEMIPVHNIRVHLDGRLAGSSARTQPGARTLPSKRTADQMTVELDRLDTWEVLEIT